MRRLKLSWRNDPFLWSHTILKLRTRHFSRVRFWFLRLLSQDLKPMVYCEESLRRAPPRQCQADIQKRPLCSERTTSASTVGTGWSKAMVFELFCVRDPEDVRRYFERGARAKHAAEWSVARHLVISFIPAACVKSQKPLFCVFYLE